MKKLLTLALALGLGVAAHAQSTVYLKNTNPTDMLVGFAGSQTGCGMDLSATYMVPAYGSLALNTATMSWTSGTYDPSITGPFNWHTIRIFEECSGATGYINYLGFCMTGLSGQTIPFTPMSCAPPAVGDFKENPNGDIWISLHP